MIPAYGRTRRSSIGTVSGSLLLLPDGKLESGQADHSYLNSFGIRHNSSGHIASVASLAVRTAATCALDVIRWSLETKLYQAALNSSMVSSNGT